MRAAGSGSLLSPLRQPAFRALWIASAVHFTGGAMHAMAASWLMVQITGSAFFAALVQTAVFLPMVLLALPAGVLADTSDRRRLLLCALSAQLVIYTGVALLTFSGWLGPGTLLMLVFAAGCCGALFSPAWNTSVADTVPREDMPQAITALAISWNAARAVGPSIGGFVFASIGAGWVFVSAVVGALVIIRAIRKWAPPPGPKPALPVERLWSGTVAGLRYARHSPTIFAQLLRTVAYSGAGSALWALLPGIAAQQLMLGAAGFGLLVGCLGVGAVAGGLLLGTVRARVGIERLMRGGSIVFAGAMLVAAYVRVPAVVYAALCLGGAAWMAVMATFNTATQSSAPPWVRSRATALHTVSALGSFAIGSALWGFLSSLAGLPAALTVGAAAMASGMLLARRFPLRIGADQEVTPAALLEEFIVSEQPLPDDGPVSVEVSYRVREGEAEAFLEAVNQLRAVRRRDGATLWRIYRNVQDPHRYVERFIVASWAEYLHQRARATLADQELEARVRNFAHPGEPVTTQHYIAQ